MKGHILLESARRYPEPEGSLTPSGYAFQEACGYWVKNGSNEIMMPSADSQPSYSKKCDRETGEDQKGE